MELNTQIWGDSTEWTLDTDTFSATNSPYPAYTGKYKYLKDYRAAQVFDFGTEIDNTILYCGQAAEVSPLGGAAAFYYNDNFEGTPEPYIQRNETVSTFLASIGDYQTQHTVDAANIASSTLTSILYYKGAVQGADNTRWVIDGGEYITGGDDWYNVADMNAPIVDFNPKCLFGVIYVVAGNENDGVSTMTLHQLEAGNYSNYKIYKAFMNVATVDAVSGSSPYTTAFKETYSSSLTPNKKGLGIIDYTPWEIEGKQYVNYIQNGRAIANYPSIPLFGFDLGVVYLYHYNKFGFSWRSYHYVWNGAERDWAQNFSKAPIFYGAAYATFTDVYALKDTSYTDVSFIGYMNNTEESRENIRKMAACYGIYFTEYNRSEDSTLFDSDDRYTNAHMHLGLLRGGVGYGDYTTGTGNINNPAYNWTSSHQSGYVPGQDVDPNTYNNTTVFNTVAAGAMTNRRYLLDADNVRKVSQDLFDICDDLSQGGSIFDFFDSKVKDSFLTQSPIDCIVSLIRFPFTPNYLNNLISVQYGKITKRAEGYAITNAIQTIDFEGKKLFPRFKNSFLDYEPYTKYEVYVPFCGTVSLSAADILGHTLNVKLIVDLFNGLCTGYILADSLCIETVTGKVGVEIPISGIDSATINSNIANAESNYKQARVNELTGVLQVASSPKQIASNFNTVFNTPTERKQAYYELSHINTPPHTIGAATALTGWAMDLNARIMIYYPEGDIINSAAPNSAEPPELNTLELEKFGKIKGFACLQPGIVSDFEGFTVGTIIANGIPCTESERDRIKSLFESGVFLPEKE